MGFARVYSGVLRQDKPMFVLSPKYTPRITEAEGLSEHAHKFVGSMSLFMIMGTDLMALDSVPAGNILGIGGLGTQVLKSATLSSTLACPSFANLTFQVCT